ncbi:MAG: ABC transporter permease [Patescibacteria group bacterium]
MTFTTKIFRLAFESLLAHSFRAFLTMLGIVIGGATIILVVGLGEGAKRDIDAQYSNMSVTTILINAPSAEDGTKSKLSLEDAEDIAQLETIVSAVPQTSGKVNVAANGTTASFTVIGSTPNIFSMLAAAYQFGEQFTLESEDNREKVAVIGATVAEDLFESEPKGIVGQEINLGKKTFTIVGVLEYRGGAFGPISVDESIFVPYSAGYRYVLGKQGKFNINAQATDINVLDIAMEDISRILRDNHNIKVGGVDDFRVRDMGTNVQSAKESATTMSFLLGSVGFVVLLVGGIGIMNIMYVSVHERTKEIGLRKAIGAKNSHIKLQFLFEAVILSSIGYVIGAILAFALYFGLESLGVSIVNVWWSYLLSLFFVFSTGVIFGYFPAQKAASLHPIEALRYE